MSNYFELYGLPLSFSPDQSLVKKQFYALSKKYHPDFFATKGEAEQEEALLMSTENTKAYQTLSDPKKVLPYVLTLSAMLEEGEQYTLPQDFLMEMMEINEVLMELQFDPNPVLLEKTSDEITKLEAQMDLELSTQTQDFDALDNHHKQVKLVKIKDLYYRAKYLARLKETLSKMK